MIPSFLFYLTAGGLTPVVGFTGVGLALAAWGGMVGRRSVLDGRIIVNRSLLAFVPVFLVLVLVSYPRWDAGTDLKDPVAAILFFSIVPSLIVAFSLRDDDWLDAARRTVTVAFVLFSLVIVAWTAVNGVDWRRAAFLFPTWHKNSVAATYEVLLLSTMLDRPEWHRRLGVAALGLVCLALIGSKTGLGLTTMFVVVILFRWVGVAGIVLVLAASFGFIRANLALEGPLETAVQRFIMWAHAWDQITASPSHWWFGVGPGTYVAPTILLSVVGIEGTHNILLQFWHSYGMLGLMLFGALFVHLARRYGFARSPFLAAFWLFNLHALFDVGWVKGPGFVASAALGLGLADVLRREARATT
jgi:O-antigen ligase